MTRSTTTSTAGRLALVASLSAALLLAGCSDDAPTTDGMLGAQRDAVGSGAVLVQQAGTVSIDLDVPAATAEQLSEAGVDGPSAALEVYVSCAEAVDATLTLDGAALGSVTCTSGGAGDWTSVSTDPVDTSAEHTLTLTSTTEGEIAVTVALPAA